MAKKNADSHRRHAEFEVGDKVFLSTENLSLKLPVDCAKLAQRRCGPFVITEKLSPVSYRLDIPHGWKIHPVFHIGLLTPCHETDAFPTRAKIDHPPPTMVDNTAYWDLEAIIDRRWNDAKQCLQYLVKWKGYDNHHNSWENADALAEQGTVAAMVREYNIKHHTAPGRDALDEEEIACEICRSLDDDPPMLICDKCDRGYHITCHGPSVTCRTDTSLEVHRLCNSQEAH